MAQVSPEGYNPAVDPHRLAQERSLAYHRAVAIRMDRDPAIAERAMAKVRAVLAEGREVHYARLWEALLTGPVERLREVLIAETEEARALRQSTPFAGAIEPRERWRIWKETRERAAGR